MRLLSIAAVLIAGIASSASAQIASPGLGLDRPDLLDPGFQGSAEVKGRQELEPPPYGSVGSSAYLRGALLSGVWSACYAGCLGPSPVALSQTLMPPFLIAGVGRNSSTATTSFFSTVSAHIYEPESIKRKGSAAASRMSLKQKAFVGMQLYVASFTSFGGSGFLSSIAGIEECKAQGELREETAKESARFKLSCKKDSLPDPLSAFLEDMGLKNIHKWSLRAENP